MTTKIQVTSPSGLIYTAVNHIGGTEKFTIYGCSSQARAPNSLEDNKCLILKIASDLRFNGVLDKEAYILKAMLDEAAKLESAFLEKNHGTETRINYQFTFPNLVETFVSEEQKSRRVLILSLDNIASNLDDLVPLYHLESKDHVRVDQRTSAWIMGKLLKTLVFIYDMGITNGMVYRDNILINKEEHFVAFFNWTEAEMGNLVEQKGAQEIAQLAQAITRTLGGDPKTGTLPEDKQSDVEYGKFIRKLALGKVSSTQSAHNDFYTLIRRIWSREFYPFTTHPLG